MSEHEAFGYTVRVFTSGTGDDAVELAEVDLGGKTGKIVMTAADHHVLRSLATDKESYRAEVVARKDAAKEEWTEKRSMASKLGLDMESGTPTADHSSEPSAFVAAPVGETGFSVHEVRPLPETTTPEPPKPAPITAKPAKPAKPTDPAPS